MARGIRQISYYKVDRIDCDYSDVYSGVVSADGLYLHVHARSCRPIKLKESSGLC